MDNVNEDPDYTSGTIVVFRSPPVTRSRPNAVYAMLLSNGNGRIDPLSVKEALSSDNRLAWKNAMMEEMNSLLDNQSWELVKRPIDHKILKSMWAFKTKHDGYGNVQKFKARLVAKGCGQVIRYSSIRFFCYCYTT